MIAAPPRGHLFQERLCASRNRFWMMVACQLVNRATWEVAEPIHKEIRRRYPTIWDLAMARHRDLVRIIRPLGFQNGRAKNLKAMARAWDAPRTAADILELPGCGKYAADSWAIFVEGNLDVQPNDGKLNWYLAQTMD